MCRPSRNTGQGVGVRSESVICDGGRRSESDEQAVASDILVVVRRGGAVRSILGLGSVRRSCAGPTRRARELAMPSPKPVESRVAGRRGADVQLVPVRCGQGRNTHRTADQLVLGEISQRKAALQECGGGRGRATVAGSGTVWSLPGV